MVGATMGVPQRIVIVGAGVAGASVAFGLARRGHGPAVTVVDAARAGTATAAGAGMVAPWDTPLVGPYYDLYAAGAAFYPSLIDALDAAGVGRAAFAVAGAMVVSDDADRLDQMEARVRPRLAAAGPAAGDAVRLTPAQARHRLPPLADGWAGLLMTGGARIDGRQLLDRPARRRRTTRRPPSHRHRHARPR